jgi:hypothetical protein
MYCCECEQRCTLIMTALLFYLPVRTVQCIYIPLLVTVHGGLRPSMVISDVEVSGSSLPET